MRKVVYLMNASLDGYVEGPDGKFGWTTPDEEVHRFHKEIADSMAAFLYGRRLYETMAVWQTIGEDSGMPGYMMEYARMWRSKPKIVFSTTLQSVGPGCRLVRGDIVRELEEHKRETGGPVNGPGDLSVGGPGLASSLARLDLIDEYRLVLFPVMVGGGKPYFSAPGGEVRLRLLESRTFACGAVYLRYVRV